jgi:glycosyltransferase involved in cell wall biosynthesis
VLYYLGIADLPGKMAHSIQEMRMCEAFAETGEKVVYLHGHVLGEFRKVTWDDVADHYGLETRFAVKTFRNLFGKTGRFTKIGTMSMAGPIAAYVFLEVLAGRLGSDDVIYGRNYYPLYFLTELLRFVPKSRKPPVIYEHHDRIKTRFTERFFSQIDGIVCITKKLADYTVEKHDIERSQILVAPDGVDLTQYSSITTSEARRTLNLPADRDIVMYTGNLYEMQGVETLVRAAEGLDASIYVVGGHQEDRDRIKSRCSIPETVEFVGFVEPSSVPVYQSAADILVAPYAEHVREFASPLKLFEYMAAGKPIVISDHTVFKEVLTEGTSALFFESESPESLRETLNNLLDDQDLRQELGSKARSKANEFSWFHRAEKIISFSHTQI